MAAKSSRKSGDSLKSNAQSDAFPKSRTPEPAAGLFQTLADLPADARAQIAALPAETLAAMQALFSTQRQRQ